MMRSGQKCYGVSGIESSGLENECQGSVAGLMSESEQLPRGSTVVPFWDYLIGF